jgi:hypothetical protein
MASRMLRSVLLGAAILSLCGPAVAQDADEEPDPVILGIALADAVMTLPGGLAASEVHGRPVSAKFEMPGGDPRLSDASIQAFRPMPLAHRRMKT